MTEDAERMSTEARRNACLHAYTHSLFIALWLNTPGLSQARYILVPREKSPATGATAGCGGTVALLSFRVVPWVM